MRLATGDIVWEGGLNGEGPRAIEGDEVENAPLLDDCPCEDKYGCGAVDGDDEED
jgi:hypothetical protein